MSRQFSGTGARVALAILVVGFERRAGQVVASRSILPTLRQLSANSLPAPWQPWDGDSPLAAVA